MARGIDVSSYQGYPNFGSVRGAGIEFAYIKATEATNYVAATVDRQWADATRAGIVCGLYHFGRPNNGNPEGEAELFARLINAKGAKGRGFLPPCLDLEVGSGGLGWYVGRFIARLRARIGDVPVMVYSGGSFYRTQIGDGALPANTFAWIAHYNGSPGNSSYLTPKTVMHQYADNGRVAGISGNVDMNWATRSLDEITGGGAAAAPGGIETLAFDDWYKDWAGNDQTTLSWMNHVDQRLAELHDALLGMQQSRYVAPDGTPSDVEINAVTAIFDSNKADYENVDRLAALHDALLTERQSTYVGPDGKQSEVYRNPVDMIVDNNKADFENVDRLAAVKDAVAHLTDVLGSLSDLDGDEIASKVQEAVAHALAENTVHVDVHVSGKDADEDAPVDPPAVDGAPKS